MRRVAAGTSSYSDWVLAIQSNMGATWGSNTILSGTGYIASGGYRWCLGWFSGLIVIRCNTTGTNFIVNKV